MAEPEYYDDLETRDPAAREKAQFAALRELIGLAKAKAPGWARILKDADPAAVTDRKSLARLPVTRKSELTELQRADLPFGGLTTRPAGQLRRLFASPGPIYDPEGNRKDYWRMARALFAAGFRPGDVVHNSFSYHLTPAGAMLEDGAHALGCAVIPGGVGQTDLQVRTIAELRPAGYVGTPSFLKILLDKGKELDKALPSLKRALVSGEALPPSLRAELEGHGMLVLQAYGTADAGLVAYESEAKEGLIVDEAVILELVRPGTGDPVPEGEVGEVVVNVLNQDYPLIRFATGDLSALLPGKSPCGRTGMRIKGLMGRADQTTKVRGMFVRPSQIAEVAKRHPEILKARLVVDRHEHQDVATFRCEVQGAPPEGLARAVTGTVQSICKVRADVAFVAPGGLPNDGKVIDDIRKYQ
jgi:phenylacetate-coenzyme A ligase PaaK-like adenylate-forming protein